MPTKKLIIMRGLPGSGKTAKAKELREKFQEDDMSVSIHSADHFFVNDDLEYHFKPHLIGEAHAACFLGFIKSLQNHTEVVIVDNTNSRKWEYAHYQAAASAMGVYDVLIIHTSNANTTISEMQTYAARNVHGVPLEAIGAMAARWES